jgi:hypothetical protein
MFLAIAYALFLFQIITILLLISPISIRIRQYISNLALGLSQKYIYVQCEHKYILYSFQY